MSALGSCGVQKRLSDPLDLELRTVVSHHVGAEQPVRFTTEPSLQPHTYLIFKLRFKCIFLPNLFQDNAG